MEKKKKYRLPSTELIDLLIDKELEPYGVTCEEMRNLPDGKIDGIHWYEYYTFLDNEEYTKWKEFCLDVLSNQITPKLSKFRIEKEFEMLDLMWGLKRNHE